MGPTREKSIPRDRQRPGPPVQGLRRGSRKDGHPEDSARDVLFQPRQDQPGMHRATTHRPRRRRTPLAVLGGHLLTSSLVLRTVIIYGVERPILHYAMVAIVGVIVATNLFLVLELANPYVGEVSTSSDPLQEVVVVLSQPFP